MGRSDVGRNAIHGAALQPGGGAEAGDRDEARRRPAVIHHGRRKTKDGKPACATLAALLLVLVAARPAAHDPITTTITFTREIRAILSARCASCHAPGGSAPMPLTTYENVRPWARAIKEQVLARRMPQWHAARGFGSFKNDPTLTPIEIAMMVAWVDGGLPRGANGAKGAKGANGAGGAKGAASVIVAARAEHAASGHRGTQWVTGWSFEPGDPLITEAVITSDAGVVGNWVAGDPELRLPIGSAVRVAGRVHVDLRRRTATDYEQPFYARRSILRFTTREKPPRRRVWTEEASCGTPRAGRSAELIAIRPVIDDHGAVTVWLERAGAPTTIIGWFRDFDSRLPRTYWLARPADFPTEARLQGDAPCQLQLTLLAHH